jgi:hypothetical protein
MTDGTKGGAQRASSLRPRCFGVVDPETVTHIYLSSLLVRLNKVRYEDLSLQGCYAAPTGT